MGQKIEVRKVSIPPTMYMYTYIAHTGYPTNPTHMYECMQIHVSGLQTLTHILSVGDYWERVNHWLFPGANEETGPCIAVSDSAQGAILYGWGKYSVRSAVCRNGGSNVTTKVHVRT